MPSKPQGLRNNPPFVPNWCVLSISKNLPAQIALRLPCLLLSENWSTTRAKVLTLNLEASIPLCLRAGVYTTRHKVLSKGYRSRHFHGQVSTQQFHVFSGTVKTTVAFDVLELAQPYFTHQPTDLAIRKRTSDRTKATIYWHVLST